MAERSLKTEVRKAVRAFGQSSKKYSERGWDSFEARLWFNVIGSVIEDWIKEPTTATGEQNRESAETFLFGKTEKMKARRQMVCECAGIHRDSLIRFVTALKAEVQRRSDSETVAAAG